MGAKTGISWTESTWNPVTGCTPVSPGCDFCYASSIAHRFAGTAAYPRGFEITLRPERLAQPLRWSKPRMIFVNSMSDLWHRDISDDYIAQVFAVMALSGRHTFQVLTKRHARMRSMLSDPWWWPTVHAHVASIARTHGLDLGEATFVTLPGGGTALSNVWVGVTVEDQKWADIRIPALLATPAARRFLSCEPLLGPVTLGLADHDTHERDWDGNGYVCLDCSTEETTVEWFRRDRPADDRSGGELLGLDWVIVGGESGPQARPMHPQWARALREECGGAQIAFHFKQWGSYTLEAAADGRGPDVLVWPDATTATTDAVQAAEAAESSAVTARAPEVTDRVVAMWRSSKKDAGNVLDGRTHQDFPAPYRTRPVTGPAH